MKNFESISPVEAHDVIAQGGGLIFDVRTAPEFFAHRIEGARLLPIQELHARHGEIPRDSELKLLIVCEHGIRSVTACEALGENGWRNVVNVMGGMAAWMEAGLPVVVGVKG